MQRTIFITLMTTLKKKITSFLKEKNLNPSSFCKNTNMSHSAIHNILNSPIPNPTIETVLEIAKVMNCSLNDLFDQGYTTTPTLQIKDVSLLKSVCLSLCNEKAIEGKTFEEFLSDIKYIYIYCIDNKLKSSDKNFVNWYLKNKSNINL